MRRLGIAFLIVVATIGVLDWPVQWTGPRFRWIVSIAALILWKRLSSRGALRTEPHAGLPFHLVDRMDGGGARRNARLDELADLLARPHQGAVRWSRFLSAAPRYALTIIALAKTPAIVLGLGSNASVLRTTESAVDVGAFDQVVVTRHEPYSISGSNAYRVTRRYHVGPVGLDVPVGTIYAKCAPEVSREKDRVRVSSYGGSVVVPLD